MNKKMQTKAPGPLYSAEAWLATAQRAIEKRWPEAEGEARDILPFVYYSVCRARHYLACALELLSKSMAHAGLALVRPILEITVTWLWVSQVDSGPSPQEKLERVKKKQIRESLKWRKLREPENEPGAASKSDGDVQVERLEGAMRDLGEVKESPGIRQMLEDLGEGEGRKARGEGLYALWYLFLCPYVHGATFPDELLIESPTELGRWSFSTAPSYDAPKVILDAAHMLAWSILKALKLDDEANRITDEFNEAMQHFGGWPP